jgi:cytochrome b6-f complex iron-sulfur subunit
MKGGASGGSGLDAHGRRDWLRAVLSGGFAASVGSFLYPVVRFIWPPAVAESTAVEVVAAKTSELPPNNGKVFAFGSRPAIVVRTPAGDWRAFTAVCTHLNCTVQYRSDMQMIWCACHNGMYDLNGKVISGPPPRPLDEYTVHIRGEEVVVSRTA